MGETISYKLVMLPTEKASKIWIDNDTKKLVYGIYSLNSNNCINQRLYITSNQEITKDCKWYIDDTNTVRENVVNDIDYWAARKDYKEIIASSDKSITPNSWIDLLSNDWIIDEYNKNKVLPDIELNKITIKCKTCNAVGRVHDTSIYVAAMCPDCKGSGTQKILNTYPNGSVKCSQGKEKKVVLEIKPVFTSAEILNEMDADMEDSGMAQGEIESNINHWRNKYLITRR